MNCPYCGTSLLETDTCCSYCHAKISPAPSVPEEEPTQSRSICKTIGQIFLVLLLYAIAIVSIVYMCTDQARLSGTWTRQMKGAGSDEVIYHQYEFTPFGIMTQTVGDVSAKGSYKIEENKILFTPNRDEDATEEIEFRLGIDGKLYLKGDNEHPFLIQGFPYAAIFLLIAVASFVAATYLLMKKLIRSKKDRFSTFKHKEEIAKTANPHDFYDLPPLAGVPARRPDELGTPYVEPAEVENWFISVDAPADEPTVDSHDFRATSYDFETEHIASEPNPFQRGGDL